MKQHILTLTSALLAASALVAAAEGNTIVGTWILDPARVTDHWRRMGVIQRDDPRQFTPTDLTTRQIVATETNIAFFSTEGAVTNAYTILAVDSQSAAISVDAISGGEAKIITIEFADQGMWLSRDQGHKVASWLFFKKAK